MGYYTYEKYFGSDNLLRNGYRDQYPEVPLGVEAQHLREIEDAERRIRTGDALSVWQEIAMAGRANAEALAPEERATTDLIDRWMKGGHISHSGYILGRHNIAYVSTQTVCVATRYEGKIAYLWGSMPGHRFPRDAIGYTAREWHEVIEAIKKSRAINTMSYRERANKFSSLLTNAENMPGWTSHRRIVNQYGVEGFLQVVFGSRYTAAIAKPDVGLLGKIKHLMLKRIANPDYALLSMEDAIELKMRLPSGESRGLHIIDLAREL